MVELAVEARGLEKRFGATHAVRGVDLSVRTGSVYGVLGPNGAGKTTTLRMLATLLRPDAGEARVMGHDIAKDPEAVRAAISLTGQFASVDEDLTGRENLVLLGRLLGLGWGGARERADELLAAFDLSEAAVKQVKTYSGGMRRRIDIAASIVVTPELLFLDEPTTGLDPRSRNQVWDIVRALVRDGATVLLTTQYLEEADQLAERIAVIDRGQVIAEGTSATLKASIGVRVLHLAFEAPEIAGRAAVLLADKFGLEALPDADPAALSVQAGDSAVAASAISALDAEGMAVMSFAFGQPSLDEVFLALTGRPPADAKDEDTP
ncbi:ATP-binding cassette domain-containing protein [Pelagibacterium montanilacus]|uniref:ATP-binding cassette domain-containing protein n=1 Tax=Pelagibacterium montanilacus TaxID=2185280 RepID=UPI000F8D20DC|nr:ATP-binding cassette domain-containing protein [Pelagibacterium montanilacus]